MAKDNALLKVSNISKKIIKDDILNTTQPSWSFIDGCLVSSLIQLYHTEKDAETKDYLNKYFESVINSQGEISIYDKNLYDLSSISSGKNLFYIYELTGKKKYLSAIETLRNQLHDQPRTKNDMFCQSNSFPNQVWLKGFYMAHPFYTEYEMKFNKMRGCLDIFSQFCNAEKIMKDRETGLYFSAFDESRSFDWADKATGLSSDISFLNMGLYAAALTDTLEVFDEQLYYEYRTLESILKDLIDALIQYQQPTGLFILNENESKADITGAFFIAYSILKAARLKLLPRNYYCYGVSAFYAAIEHTCTSLISDNIMQLAAMLLAYCEVVRNS